MSLEAAKPRMAGPQGTQGQKESEDNIQLTSLVAGPGPPPATEGSEGEGDGAPSQAAVLALPTGTAPSRPAGQCPADGLRVSWHLPLLLHQSNPLTGQTAPQGLSLRTCR